MKNLIVEDAAPLALEADIRAWEQANGITLPAELVALFTQVNPIYVTNDFAYFEDWEKSIQGFLPFIDAATKAKLKIPSFQGVNKTFQDFFQHNYVAFADDPGGWHYVISVLPETYGQVFFCRLDTEIPEALTYLTPNLTAFLDMLEPWREG